jgi:hypothetical protein
MSAGHRVPLAYFGCNFAWSLLTKGAIAGIGKRRCAEALQTLSPGSPLPVTAAHTYLLKGLKCPGYIYTPFALPVPRPCTYLKGHR